MVLQKTLNGMLREIRFDQELYHFHNIISHRYLLIVPLFIVDFSLSQNG